LIGIRFLDRVHPGTTHVVVILANEDEPVGGSMGGPLPWWETDCTEPNTGGGIDIPIVGLSY